MSIENHPLFNLMTERGIPVDLDVEIDPFRNPQWVEKNFEKVRRVTAKARQQNWDGDRIYPRWGYKSDSERIIGRVPNPMILPLDVFFYPGSPLLCPNFPFFEAVVYARLMGEEDLARRMLAGEKLSEVLREPLARPINIMDLKAAFFKHCYGAWHAMDEVETRYANSILHFFPGFKGIEPRTPDTPKGPTPLMREVNRFMAQMILAVCEAIDTLPECQVVGVIHTDPLIEYTGSNPKRMEERISSLTYDILKAWQPEEAT